MDIISDLPGNIIDNILTLLPLQAAGRTSILSRNWRYQWTRLPQLVFDDKFNPISQENNPRDIVRKIYEILLLHQGPISKFTLDISSLTSRSEINKLILLLSTNGIQDFTLCMSREQYKLPSYFFSCSKLRHLFLSFCVFEPPPTFKGFSKLITLEIWDADLPPNVWISNYPLLESLTLQTNTIVDSFSIDASHLKSFWFIGIMKCVSFINTPLLAHLSFATDSLPELGQPTIDLINVFCCLPHIEHLHLDYPYLTTMYQRSFQLYPLLESLTLQTNTIVDSFSIDASHLKSFWFIGIMKCVSFINTPLLAHLSFATDSLPELGQPTIDLINVFCCLPHIEHLHLDYPYLTLLAVDNVPKKLPTLLSYLKFLELTAVSFTAMDELSSTLCLISSSPNLHKLRIQVSQGSHNDEELVLEYLGMQDYSDIYLDKLREVEMDGDLNGLRPDLEFIQFLLAKSPTLEKMYLGISTSNIGMNLDKMLVEFAWFQRASQKAEIMFPCLDLDQA